MKKYPISKKAIAVAIVTTMAITPFATLAPLAGDSSTVYADEVTVAEVSSFVERVNEVYAEFLANYAEEGDGSPSPEKETLDDLRDLVEGFNLSTSNWNSVVSELSNIDDLNVDAGLAQYPAGYAQEFLAALSEIFVNSNPSQLEADVEQFITDFEPGFKAVFGDDIELSDLFQVFVELEKAFKAEPATAGDLTRSAARQYLEDRVDDVLDANNTILNKLLDTLSDEYQITRQDVRNMLNAARDEIVGTDLTDAQLTALAIAFFESAEAFDPQLPPPSGGGGGFVPPVEDDDEDETETPIDEEEVTVPDDTTSEERVTDPVTGQVTVITTVNAEQLEALLDGEEFDRVSFNLTPADGEYAVLRLSDDVLDVIRAANPDAIIEVATLEGSFAIPVAELDYTSVDISVNEVDYDASENQVTPVAPVVEFLVVATINGQQVEITRFDSPVERTIVANDDLSNNAVVVRLNTNGTITGVATKRDGDTATFTGFTNSLYTVVENSVSYSDVPSSLWSSEVITKLSTQYILRGFSSGDFRPTGTASRAEFAAIISRGLSLTGGSTYMGQFTDVVGNEWYMGDLVAVTDYDLIRGYENNTFRGNNEVTRQEAATIIVRAMELLDVDFDLDESVDYTDFSDSADVAPYARESVTILSQAGLIEGRPGNNFAPRANISRQEVAALVERFLVKADFLD